MIRINDKSQCCGCTACYTICPKNCITMEPDEEGFLYPVVDADLCVNCHACEKVCPMVKPYAYERTNNSLFAGVQYRIEASRKTSTAGGAFSAIAEFLIEQKHATVFAVGYSDNMVVCHKAATEIHQLEEMRGSKYVQSTLNNTFAEIETLLRKKKTVLFVGTPCQVHGLKNYVGHSECLWTIDLLCLGVTSPGLFAEWVNYLECKYKSGVTYVRFRDKSYGYATPNVRVLFKNGKKLQQTYDAKVHANLFFKGYYNVRPSCYECNFREIPRVSDFTIGDFVDVGNHQKEMDDDLGTTRIWVHTTKAKELWHIILPKFRSVILQSDSSNVLGGPKKQVPKPERRSEFFDDVQSMDYAPLIHKWQPNTLRSRCANLARRIIRYLPFRKAISQNLRKRQAERSNQRVKSAMER